MAARDDHSSGTRLAARLTRPTRTTRRERLRGHGTKWGFVPCRRPPLFGLAPGGVCPAAPVARGAVRSCRAVSPLPAGRVAATCTGGLFSVALSLGSPPPDVIRHRIPVEPGLSSARSPGRARRQAAAVRPSGDESIAGNRGTGQASRRALPASRRTADSRSRVPASASPVTASGRQ